MKHKLNLCPRIQLKTPIYIEEIAWLEGLRNYTLIYLQCGRKILVSKTLWLVEQNLPEEMFLRINRSFLVNINAITNWNLAPKSPISITLTNGQIVEVSRRKKRQIKNYLETC